MVAFIIGGADIQMLQVFTLPSHSQCILHTLFEQQNISMYTCNYGKLCGNVSNISQGKDGDIHECKLLMSRVQRILVKCLNRAET